jgi:hypothetical protein
MNAGFTTRWQWTVDFGYDPDLIWWDGFPCWCDACMMDIFVLTNTVLSHTRMCPTIYCAVRKIDIAQLWYACASSSDKKKLFENKITIFLINLFLRKVPALLCTLWYPKCNFNTTSRKKSYAKNTCLWTCTLYFPSCESMRLLLTKYIGFMNPGMDTIKWLILTKLILLYIIPFFLFAPVYAVC